MLPNFFVVGAQKSATTSLHQYLSGHPDIFLPPQKETHFFIEDARYELGIDHYEREYFSGWSGERSIGEIDPDYMYFQETLPRMLRHFDPPTLSFIFILRNPVERAFSHYLMTYRRGLEPLSFEEAIEREPERVGTDFHSREHYSYVGRGFYHRQITRYLDHVDRDRILVLLTDDLKRDPRPVIRRLFDFLGVDNTYSPPDLNTEYHRAAVPHSMAFVKWLTGGDSPEKKVLRLLMPHAGLRSWMRRTALSLNLRPQNSLQLSDSARNKLLHIYAADMRQLAALIGGIPDAWGFTGDGTEK